ncbi:MAG: carbohydrate ABC transporter permease [Boseongicola sp. SB0676_bin_33]|nr:carbohydrate ABC transporter permease [Boseongicola sp. SB0676_bin_33]MYK32328.1 carbohydrate ABC transporter permease [Boseongicola sp. SB0670_bin_30]
MSSAALRQPMSLKVLSNGFLAFWCIVAAFPIAWIAVMSFKTPIDAFDSNPFRVIFGPHTRASIGGLSLIDIVLGLALAGMLVRQAIRWLPGKVVEYAPNGRTGMSWLVGGGAYALVSLVLLVVVLPAVLGVLNPVLGPLGTSIVGLTTEHYEAVWIDRGFTRNFANSMIVTSGVVLVSLTVGTLAGYGLAREDSVVAFWLLVVALVFRALPHSVLVAGYLPYFITSAEWLAPIFGDAAPTLYGKPWAIIAVLVAINQPFTIWMLRSFFQNIPAELDEAARVDGCSHFGAFRRVIVPVMWPGVITTGLFSFLLAYNDFLVTSLLLDAQNMTMVPAIANMFNRETTASDEVQAIAAAVSITAPLFVLVLVFQRQIVSGMTAGAVKG